MVKTDLHKRTISGTMKEVLWHPSALDTVREFSEDVRGKIGYLLHLVQKGEVLQLPHSRSMSSVASGAHEIRVKDRDGIYRVFYLMKMEDGIYVFHAFQKKTGKTPIDEIRLAKKRLQELMEK